MLTQTVVIKSKKSTLTISASAKRRRVLMNGSGSFSPDQLPDLFRVLKDFAAAVRGAPKVRRKAKVKTTVRRSRKVKHQPVEASADADLSAQTDLPLPAPETLPVPRRLRRLKKGQDATASDA